MKKNQSMKYQLRSRLEALRGRIIYLPRGEQLLVNIFLNGCSFTQIGFLANVTPATVARRLIKILRRLSHTNYMLALHRNNSFDQTQKEILRRYFVKGQSMTAISKKIKCSRAYISKTIRQLEMKIEAELR